MTPPLNKRHMKSIVRALNEWVIFNEKLVERLNDSHRKSKGATVESRIETVKKGIVMLEGRYL